MKGITTPEVIIYNALEGIVNFIRKDLELNKDNEQKCWLYKLIGEDEDGNPIKMNRYNYFTQAKKIFSDVKNLKVNFGYNFEVAKIISLHIILPSESPIAPTLGEDEGYQVERDEETGKSQFKYTQMFDTNYQVMITSDNGSETNIVYTVIKAALIAIVPQLSLLGLMNPKYSGNDIMFNDSLMPAGLFHKVLNLSFQYEMVVPQLALANVFNGFRPDGHPIEKITDDCGRHDDVIDDFMEENG